jgi:hypothetical protein
MTKHPEGFILKEKSSCSVNLLLFHLSLMNEHAKKVTKLNSLSRGPFIYACFQCMTRCNSLIFSL